MTRPAAAANPLLLLPALHDALGAWGTAPGREHAEALRDGLRAHVLAALRECSTDSRPVPSRRAAAALWVSLKALQRWTAPGGCASGVDAEGRDITTAVREVVREASDAHA